VSTGRPPLAKISTPRLFGVVERANLFARLEENRGRPLIWIEGPPGAGKTTLAASYLEVHRVPTLWYQVDAADADPANLFHYLAIGAASLVHGRPPPLPRLVPEHLSDLPAFAHKYFRELFTYLPAGAVIVLDNYQEVPADASLHPIVRAAVGEVPPQSSLIVVSRLEAAPLFAPLIANGSAFTLKWEALRLTLEETRAISAAREMRDDWLVRALHQQSEGWAAGVTLMLERLQHTDGDARELPNDTRESVFDYFASLLFDNAPEASRHTLLAIAHLPHATPSMAVQLSGDPEAGALLERLYRRHLFTNRRPGAEPVYQFHALFRGFLEKRARESYDAEELRARKLISARSLAEAGELDAAIELFTEAQAWDDIVDAALRQAPALVSSARWQTLERWIGALPNTVQARHPRAIYWLGMAEVPRNPAQGMRTLLRAREAFAQSSDRTGRVECLAALLNTAQMGHAAISVADGWLGELLEEVAAGGEESPRAAGISVWSAILGIIVYWRPWHAAAKNARQRIHELLQTESDPAVALAAATTALVTDTATGSLEAAEELIKLIEPLVSSASASPSASAWFLFGAAYLRFVQARYEESLDYFDRSIQAASVSGLVDTLSDIRLYRVMVEFRSLGWTVADATLRQIEAEPLPRRPRSIALLRIYQARRAHAAGKWSEAADLALLSYEAIVQTGVPEHRMSFGLFVAEILTGAGRVAEAHPLLDTSTEIIARGAALDCWFAAARLGDSYLALIEGREQAAKELLADALTAAMAGNRRFYLRYMECCMTPMFSLALREGIQVDLVRQLIDMFRLKPPPDAPDAWPRAVRIRTLGRFEVLVREQPLEFSRKVPKKTLALLKALIAYRSDAVPEQWLCDSLWGDEEADAARQVLGVTVSRLRKLLGSDDAVGQQGGKIWLDRRVCWVDAWRFETLAEGKDAATVREALNLYLGAFLPDEEGESWSVAMRERLRGRFIHALATHGQALEEADDVDEATRLYLRGIDADVVVEAFHRALMRCYRRAGRLTEAVSAYRRLRQTLSAVLGVAPSTESESMYRDLMRELAANGSIFKPYDAPVDHRLLEGLKKVGSESKGE
jgi:ATP/maltotriose-dependent transcriptional regulator MalT/DNA-binding SARP family transcriptional activator